VVLLVLVTTAYLKVLNRSHAGRRAALGKKVEIMDLSLESAQEVERMGEMDRALREERERVSQEAGEDAEERGHHGGKSGKAFSDATDLENEDFVFVF
jgi:hypothetical protein